MHQFNPPPTRHHLSHRVSSGHLHPYSWRRVPPSHKSLSLIGSALPPESGLRGKSPSDWNFLFHQAPSHNKLPHARVCVPFTLYFIISHSTVLLTLSVYNLSWLKFPISAGRMVTVGRWLSVTYGNKGHGLFSIKVKSLSSQTYDADEVEWCF